jgi:transposase
MDLRERVIKAVDAGMLRKDVSKQFSVGLKTIYLWLERRKDKGDLKPITNFQQGHSHAIKDFESFKSTVSQYPDRTQKELGKLLKVSASTVCRAMKKAGYTRKKNTYGYKERNDEKRATYLTSIKVTPIV